jgi:hypothetical protein
LDFDYKEGSDANCIEILCCRADTGKQNMPEKKKVSYRSDPYGFSGT